MDQALLYQILISYTYVAIWIGLSAGVILFNKYLLSVYGFPFPIALTMIHMGFCSFIAILLIRVFKIVESINMEVETYFRAIVPIGALFSGTLWLGNAAYLYLSVSFIQMLKALMPVSVFLVGTLFGTEQYSNKIMLNMAVVTVGVMIASYGEINFVLTGVLMQLASILFESSRLTLVQILLQRRGMKLNPITTLYYIAPACFCFLSVPFVLIELPKMQESVDWNFDVTIFAANATVALGLNLAVFLLIGKTSALTMNVAGVVKDWLLIGLSALLFHQPVSSVSLGGYALAFGGVCYYNYLKLKDMQAQPPSRLEEGSQQKP
ncbi:hypothetical protein CYMTET_5732 [Cymbomonas tetramitiformis]|uniref:Sugar phosphate transporter domain-containing protein n=1 Tax=Cymbomonas tetramitiformis TaxID=36881 RepID=A0AAE0LIS3_9CHLO|nr:hypothetical protein CYMTET_5732 [Cymbomonas tetramitiformis]